MEETEPAGGDRPPTTPRVVRIQTNSYSAGAVGIWLALAPLPVTAAVLLGVAGVCVAGGGGRGLLRIPQPPVWGIQCVDKRANEGVRAQRAVTDQPSGSETCF